MTYTDATAGAAASATTTVTSVDLTGVVFDGLQKLTTSDSVTASLTVAQLADIAEVQTDNNALTVNLNGAALAADLDISNANLASGSDTIHITDLNGFTLTMSADQAEAVRVDKTTGNNGTVKIVATSDAQIDDAFITTLVRGVNGASEINTNHTVTLVVDAGGTIDISDNALSNINAFEIKADNILIATGAQTNGLTFSGAETLRMPSGTASQSVTSAIFSDAVVLDLNGNKTLSVTAAQASARTVVNSGSDGTLSIGAASPATVFDFSKIASSVGTVSLTFTSGGTLAAGTFNNWGTVDNVIVDNSTLTLTAAQATNKNIDGANNGSIVVSLDNTAGLNFGQISVQGSGTFTATVNANVTLAADADLGSLSTTVTSGHTLTLLASQADGTCQRL